MCTPQAYYNSRAGGAAGAAERRQLHALCLSAGHFADAGALAAQAALQTPQELPELVLWFIQIEPQTFNLILLLAVPAALAAQALVWEALRVLQV